MRNTRFEVRPTSGALGAELLGVDLAQPLDAEAAADIRQAFYEHGVIFFRDQRLTPQQHIAFAQRMGTININRFFKTVPNYPQIAEVRKEAAHKTNIGGAWHTDHSYDQVPALGSILLAREVPSRGGDTMFACMAQAYDALSDGLKRTLKSLRAVHSSRQVFGVESYMANPDRKDRLLNPELATQEAMHPVVIRHPETGRHTLYVNATFTTHFEGWTVEESKPLLDFLYRHAASPEFQTRFRWEEGSLAFWDNRATWHYALNDYTGEHRLMHRITLDGAPLEAAL